MAGGDSNASKAKKQKYFVKLVNLLEEYPCILIVGADNVGSNHMQQIRKALRAQGAVLLMGKNTMIRKAIRGHSQANPNVDLLLPMVKGNIGFVFAKGDLSEVKKILVSARVEAPAKAGAIAPCSVIVPAQNTGLEPTQTSFFQALSIQTKITRGQIEIVQDVPLIQEGQKVGASEANLLAKLNMRPFSYGLSLNQVYDNGSVYSHKILDITQEEILKKFSAGVRNIASLSLQVGIPTAASVPHSVARAFKNVLAISLETDYTFEKAQQVKDYLKNPGAFAPANNAPAKDTKAEAPKEAAKPKEEPKEQSDEDMGMSLFD